MPPPKGVKCKKVNNETLLEGKEKITRRSSRKKVNYVESDDDFQCENKSEESEDCTEESEDDKANARTQKVSMSSKKQELGML